MKAVSRRRVLATSLAAATFPLLPARAASEPDVVVIGAGAAGLAATAALMTKGRSVLCIEANKRIGGRVHTDTALFGMPYDVGAHWLHYGQANPFVDYGKREGFNVYRAPDDDVIYVGDRLAKSKERATYEKAVKAAFKAIGAAGKRGKDIAPSQVVPDAGGWTDTVHLSVGPYEMAKDFDHFSCSDWWTAEDGTDWYCREGFGTLLNHRWRDVPVTLDTTAEKIAWGGPGVQVETNKGTIKAQACIVTVSTGVLAAGQIAFDPVLPEDKRAAVSGISMGGYNHVALQFKENFFDIGADGYFTYKLENRNAPSPRGFAGLVNVGGSTLSLFDFGGDFAWEMEREGEQAAIDFVLGELTSIFGSKVRAGLVQAHATAWGQDPLIRGAYASAEPGSAKLRSALRAPLGDRVFFAGEATSPDDWATVAGADKSGRAVAEALMRIL